MAHVIVGGGHFVERAGQLVQQFADHAPVGIRILENGNIITKTGELIANNAQAIASAYDRGSRAFMDGIAFADGIGRTIDYQFSFINSENESRAWSERAGEAWDSFRDSHLAESMKEAAVSAGCAAAGDIQGAMEHGLNSCVELGQHYWESFTHGTYQRPGDGR